ncbi:MAG: membrane dipeptidase [Gemmatimonadota bacterium]|nr:membrane dipeptidase [Gemmatimonadota bacterium]
MMMKTARPGRRVLWIFLGGMLLLVLLGASLVPGMVARRMNPVVGRPLPALTAETRRIHASLMVADLHGDVLLWDRDLLERSASGHIDVPRMREGRVGIQAFTAVTKTPKKMNIESNSGDSDNVTLLAVLQGWPVGTWGSLAERALHQAGKLHATEVRGEGALVVLETRSDLEDFLAARAGDPDVVAGFLGIEGTHALEGDLANVDRLFGAGYRMFGLTHFFDNAVGGSAHGVEKGGLTAFGAAVLARMDELGILVDLAHASPPLMDDALARATRPVVVSHGGVKGTCDNRRNVSDAHLRAIAATGGVMGVGLWATALCGETPADWARAVRHAVEVMGVDHVALGSDWDGAVRAIVDAAGTAHLVQALLDEGFAADDIVKIMGGNVVRVLGEVLPTGG